MLLASGFCGSSDPPTGLRGSLFCQIHAVFRRAPSLRSTESQVMHGGLGAAMACCGPSCCSAAFLFVYGVSGSST